jgi:hypothetical protein
LHHPDLIAWADEMSTYIKSLDSNHLVSVGDEGFYCLPNATHWTENCGEGVDTVTFSQLPNIDVMSAHLYPEYWGTDAAWGTEWIKRRDAKLIGKTVMLGSLVYRIRAFATMSIKNGQMPHSRAEVRAVQMARCTGFFPPGKITARCILIMMVSRFMPIHLYSLHWVTLRR